MSDADVAAMDRWMEQPEPEPGCENAFPIASDVIGHAYGMTLRDWFAGQALNGVIYSIGSVNPSEAAKMAYAIADAMMEVRKCSDDS